ncbi:hypothetical protein [Natronoarchaeum rubrum]|uniref:hypothetical protein n=1 Tax=Natronoarchaeum rubrum TaxID=755311 RepID=UPI002111A6F5|nr:hypothetical protein [Natronoarchaeum rubrum]
MSIRAVRSRLVFLLGLAVLGIALAGIGTAFGVTAPIAADDPSGEFVVSDQNVTFSTQSQEDTVVRNLSNVTTIEIEESTDGRFTVSTERDRPLTDAERERAKAIARGNDTVRRALDAMGEYELAVEPIHKIDELSTTQISGDVSTVNESEGIFKINLSDDSLTERDDAVVVDRDPTYVDDEAIVRVRHSNGDAPTDLKYSVSVDLAAGTVTDITEETGEEPTIDFDSETGDW